MAKLQVRKAVDPKDKKAPVSAGASSVSMGMTSENNSAIIPGGKVTPKKKVTKQVKADIEVNFYLPFAQMGKSGVSVPFPVLDGSGKVTNDVEHKQIELIDKFYTVPKKEMKESAYWKRFKDLMKQSGFVIYSSINNIKELNEHKAIEAAKPVPKSKTKKIQKVFGAFRDEHLGNDMAFNYFFQCGDKVRTFREVNGQLFTSEVAMHKIFLANGYSDMGYIKDSHKLSKEILPKDETEESDD